MKTNFDCLPCLLRQTADAIERSPGTREKRTLAMREALLAASSLDFEAPPPMLAAQLQACVRESTGCADPYLAAKRDSTALALSLRPTLEGMLRKSADPFALAVKLAIAGNVIDLGALSGFGIAEIDAAVRQALAAPLHGDLEALRQAAMEASSILYLADNAGEIVFDACLIRQLLPGRVTVAVRGAPVLNDATAADAHAAGICTLATLIDTGSDVPGIVLERCSTRFADAFRRADLIIAKGQGNYETLNASTRPIFFLFKVKCSIVAAECGYTLGSHVIANGGCSNG